MPASGDKTLRRSGAARFAAHAAGNVFLGVALGLMAYWALTGVQARLGQESLLEELGPTAAAGSPATIPAAPMDWTGWATQDVPYWEALAQGGVFGRIVSKPIGLDVAVVKGYSRADLAKGPGWLQYTDVPGPSGNAGIAGHRTTFGAPFRSLHQLSPGDTIDLYSPYRRYRYVVSGSERVTPDRVDVMATSSSPQLTLSACDPPYSARYRIIVHANLVEVQRLESNE